VRIRLTRTLTDRSFNIEGMWVFLTRELVPIVRELLRALTSGPPTFSPAATITLDLAKARDFALGSPLTVDTALTLLNGVDGCEGSVVVQQDGVGAHLLTVAADGRTVLRADPAADDNPAPGAGKLTRYRYLYLTVSDVPYLIFERTYLL